MGAVYFIIKYRSAIKEKLDYQLIIAGLLLGFSFFFRFQMAFAILGLGMWLLLVNKTHWKNLMIIVLSFAVAILICILIDWWFYGNFVVTPYDYFYSNIVEHKAAQFGIEPWWYYFSKFIRRIPPPLNILLLLLFFTGLIKRPKDIMTWCIVPFVFAHFFVGHKEWRFLFPMVFPFIYLVATGLEYFIQLLAIQCYWRTIFISIIIVNLPMLLINTFSPADKELQVYKYLYDKSPKEEVVLASRELNTLYKWGLENYFYKSPNIQLIEFKNDKDFFQFLNETKLDTIYVMERKMVPEGNYPGYTNQCVLSRYPDWVLKFNINNWQSRVSVLNLQELIKTKEPE